MIIIFQLNKENNDVVYTKCLYILFILFMKL